MPLIFLDEEPGKSGHIRSPGKREGEIEPQFFLTYSFEPDYLENELIYHEFQISWSQCFHQKFILALHSLFQGLDVAHLQLQLGNPVQITNNKENPGEKNVFQLLLSSRQTWK